ncbi:MULTISPECIES: nicotinate-nicotinamide nucleotide adenylyltransferase [unclassified Moraxella]|uniref:nicotinate-nicotinamide nucleotide adenylyltransferase n=1 Tax=unclassified Moraxella TaxID=2685852 RepID=UPI003AF6B47F
MSAIVKSSNLAHSPRLTTQAPCIRVWLGGSFDPIHIGHLSIIEHVYQQLRKHFADTPIIASLLPTAGSPLKDRPTPTEQRLAMLKVAIEPYPFLHIDDSELGRPLPIFTFDTLSNFRQHYPNDIRIFILGEDSILQLDKWYRGFELMDLANLWVLPRPTVKPNCQNLTTNTNSPLTQNELNMLAKKLAIPLKNRLTFELNTLKNQPPYPIFIDSFVPPTIASRDIRQWVQQGNRQALNAVVPASVLALIEQFGLYQHQAIL